MVVTDYHGKFQSIAKPFSSTIALDDITRPHPKTIFENIKTNQNNFLLKIEIPWLYKAYRKYHVEFLLLLSGLIK